MKRAASILSGILAAGAAAGAALTLRFRRLQRRADAVWAASPVQPLDLAEVERLTVTPLVDARAADATLTAAAGVSYLLQADGARILFDLGYNAHREHPAPVQRNAAALGVDLGAVDAVVISHRHLDHVGGFQAQRSHTFVLPAGRLAEAGVPVYLPEPLHHPSANVRVVQGPQPIAPGVASLGPIPRALFWLGWTPEQALAVRLAGRGIVLIVGCGHQGVPRLIERTEALFGAPPYAIVGGLHLPVTGRGVQRVVGTGRLPWRPIGKEDVRAAIRYLRDKGVKRIALSPHDSCDWTLDAFQEAWGPDFQVVTVGQPIEF